MEDIVHFFGVKPSAQNALDLFKGEWSTRLPDSFGLTASTGPMRGMEDYRVKWFEPFVGKYSGKRVLELGPLEGGHAYMLEQRGASEVISVEANSRAYLKCLIIKELTQLQKVKFLLGDFLEYMANSDVQFDIGFACGVLYHMIDPVLLISRLAKRCNNIFVWTHYYDRAALTQTSPHYRFFDPIPQSFVTNGFRHERYRRKYAHALEWKGFCGGGGVECCWLTKETIFAAFSHFGFDVVGELLEDHINGPAMLLALKKREPIDVPSAGSVKPF